MSERPKGLRRVWVQADRDNVTVVDFETRELLLDAFHGGEMWIWEPPIVGEQP